MNFDPEVWARVPFGFWTVSLFVFGCIVGSFLNVCIHRMPRGESIVSPPSHCPYCNYSIPWYLNIPLLTWLYLRGRCANCKAPISIRYFLVELLTGVVFAVCWIKFGNPTPALALVYCFFIAGLIVATFIDFEHFIIPDEITFGGIAVGFILSFLLPSMHFTKSASDSMQQSLLGVGVGVGILYGILRLGKLFFGRQRMALEPGTHVVFTETHMKWPGSEIEYGDVLYRTSDTIHFHAQQLEMIDRCYKDVEVSLRQNRLLVGEEVFDPNTVLHMEATLDELVLPREAMGLGDVKFMGAIGAFLGWQSVVFSLAVSSMIGSVVGVTLIALKKKEWSNRLPYGPYISMAVVIWIFYGREWIDSWFASVYRGLK
jgi:leader peptidase (prepilin peptidase) / N-methyltransferase